MKHVILNGGYGVGSAGDDAPLEVLTRLLREKLNNQVRFTVMSRHVHKAFEKRYRVNMIRNLEYPSKELSRGRFLKGFNLSDGISEIERILKLFKSGDLLVLGAGNFINENARGFLRGLLPRFYANLWLAQWVDLPVMLFGLSSSPLTSLYTRCGASWLVNQASAVTFREELAPLNLMKSNITLGAYKVLPDPVLAMRKVPDNQVQKLFKKEGIPLNPGQRLSISVRSMAYKGKAYHTDYMKKIKLVVEAWLQQNEHADVLFIPQFVYTVDGPSNDRDVAREIVRRVNNKYQSRVHSVQGDYAPWETEAFYKHSHAALTTRLHAALFALRTGIPTIALAYESKTKGLIRMLQYPEKYCVGMQISSHRLIGKLERVLLEGPGMLTKVAKRIAVCGAEVERYADIALATMK